MVFLYISHLLVFAHKVRIYLITGQDDLIFTLVLVHSVLSIGLSNRKYSPSSFFVSQTHLIYYCFSSDIKLVFNNRFIFLCWSHGMQGNLKYSKVNSNFCNIYSKFAFILFKSLLAFHLLVNTEGLRTPVLETLV